MLYNLNTIDSTSLGNSPRVSGHLNDYQAPSSDFFGYMKPLVCIMDLQNKVFLDNTSLSEIVELYGIIKPGNFNEFGHVRVMSSYEPYRLADIYRRNPSALSNLKNRVSSGLDTTSIGQRYWDAIRATESWYDDDLFTKFVSEVLPDQLPADSEMCVALRLSDKPCGVRSDVHRVYSSILDVIKSTECTSITAVVGLHYPGATMSGEEIRGDINALSEFVRFFKDAGYEVNIRSSEDADLDFVYLCNAKYLTVTESGFGALAAWISKTDNKWFCGNTPGTAALFYGTWWYRMLSYMVTKTMSRCGSPKEYFPEIHVDSVTVVISTAPRTGSTLLTNIVYGLLNHSSPVSWLPSSSISNWDLSVFKQSGGGPVIVKTHCPVNKLPRITSPKTIYVSLRRAGVGDPYIIDDPGTGNLVFDYDRLRYESENELREVVEHVKIRLSPCLPGVRFDTEAAVSRVQRMDERCLDIKDKPFSYVDPFFHIHGSHRGRGMEKEKPVLKTKNKTTNTFLRISRAELSGINKELDSDITNRRRATLVSRKLKLCLEMSQAHPYHTIPSNKKSYKASNTDCLKTFTIKYII